MQGNIMYRVRTYQTEEIWPSFLFLWRSKSKTSYYFAGGR